MSERALCARDFAFAPAMCTPHIIKRIEVYIVRNVQEMCIAGNKNPLGSSLEECSTAFVPLIEIF